MQKQFKCTNCDMILENGTYHCPVCNFTNALDLSDITYNSTLFGVMPKNFVVKTFINILRALKEEAKKYEKKYNTAYGVLEAEVFILAFFIYKTLLTRRKNGVYIEDSSIFSMALNSFLDMIKNYSVNQVNELVKINRFQLSLVFRTRLSYYKKNLKKFIEDSNYQIDDEKEILIKLASTILYVIKADEIALEKHTRPFANKKEILESEIYSRQNNFKSHNNLDRINKTDLPFLKSIYNICENSVVYFVETICAISIKIRNAVEEQRKKEMELYMEEQRKRREAEELKKANQPETTTEDSTIKILIISAFIILFLCFIGILSSVKSNRQQIENNATQAEAITNEEIEQNETTSTIKTEITSNATANNTSKVSDNLGLNDKEFALAEYYIFLYGFRDLNTDSLASYCSINGTVPTKFIDKFEIKFAEIPVLEYKILEQIPYEKHSIVNEAKNLVKEKQYNTIEEFFNKYNSVFYNTHGYNTTRASYCNLYDNLVDTMIDERLNLYNKAKSEFAYLNID